MSDLQIVAVPKELYYHEVAYVRGLETAARAMLAALKEIEKGEGPFDTDQYKFACNVIETAKMIATAAIAQAEAAGITVQS